MLRSTTTLIAGAVFCSVATSALAQYIITPQPYPYYQPQPRVYYPPAQPYYAPPQAYSPPVEEDEVDPVQEQNYQRKPTHSGLSYKCAQASEFIKNNNCGPKGCNAGLCVALQHGCHINWWGHVPDCSGMPIVRK